MIPSIHTIREMFHRRPQNPTSDYAAAFAALNKAALDLEAKFKISLADFSRQTLSPAQIERSQEMAKQFNFTQPAPQGASMSFLSAIGKDFEKVFSFLGSAKGQSIITTGEGIATAVDPALSGIFTIANSWLTEILKLQALGTAAGNAPGSDAVKSAAVISTLTPQILAFAAANKMPVPDATKIQAANDALVAFLDAFGEPGTATTSTAPAPVA